MYTRRWSQPPYLCKGGDMRPDFARQMVTPQLKVHMDFRNLHQEKFSLHDIQPVAIFVTIFGGNNQILGFEILAFPGKLC